MRKLNIKSIPHGYDFLVFAPTSVFLPVAPVTNGTLLWLTAPIILLFAWQVQTVTDTQLIGWKGCLQGREWGKKLNRKQNPPCMTSPPHPPTPFFYLQHPRPPLLLFLSSILFPSSFHSCHCIFFFNPAKSVLIANHHRPAKWQIILHSFITKPSSSYFVSQHVVYVQLPCLLIQSASQHTPWQITQKDGGCSPSQMLINPNNISYVFFFI